MHTRFCRPILGVALAVVCCCPIAACSRPQVALPNAITPTAAALPAPTATPQASPTAVPEPPPTTVPRVTLATATAVPTTEPSPTPSVEDQVRSVHTKFVVDLLTFDRGIDTKLLSEVAVGAARSRLLGAAGSVESLGYRSSIQAVERFDDSMYEVHDCAQDLSVPDEPPHLRTTIVVLVGASWRVADFHTAGEPCLPSAPTEGATS